MITKERLLDALHTISGFLDGYLDESENEEVLNEIGKAESTLYKYIIALKEDEELHACCDCKYYDIKKKCTNAYSDECHHCSLWWPKEEE